MTAASLCLPLLLLLQAPRDRVATADAPAAPQGTGTIRGLVTARDTGLPLRRATVSLSGGPVESSTTEAAKTARPPIPARAFVHRTVSTNAEGVFEFDRLPAGTYRLRAAPGTHRSHWLPIAYGARRSTDVGKPIELADGQSFRADLALPRGGAINGRVLDDLGEPVSRVMVSAASVTPGGVIERVGGPTHTDDHGRFRLFGLQSGEYVVGAEARNEEWPRIEGASDGFATTYFPSTTSEAAASRVRVTAGEDAGEVEIALVRTRTFTVSGSVMNSRGEILRSPDISLVKARVNRFGYAGGGSFDSSGNFTIRHVVPGEYRLIVRPAFIDENHPPPASARRGREFAMLPLTVESDIENLVVVTRPGGSVNGQIVFAEGNPATLPPKLSVMAEYANDEIGLGRPPTSPVSSNLQFTVWDLFGPCYIRALGLPPRYVMKAVLLGGADITDRPVEFKAGHDQQLQVIVTGRASTLTGTVTDERGEPASEVSVLILPEDKSSWRWGSPRLRITTASDGKFRMPGVLAGTYQVIAVPREHLRPSRGDEPGIFEPFLRDPTTVVVGEDETRTVDLRVTTSRD